MNYSKERAEEFVTDILGLPNPHQLFKEDKLKLLSMILEAYQATIPFQCLSLMSVPLSDRRRPTIEESIAYVEAGIGGLCYSLNVFLKILLDALGYSTYSTAGACLGDCKIINHYMVIATDVVVPGDKYLVDAGTGFHTALIPLDFEKESPVHEDGFLKYKYVLEDGLLKRYYLRRGEGERIWKVFCVSDMVPKDLSSFDTPMERVYTDPSVIPFHTSMRAIKFPNEKAKSICDMKLLIEDDTHSLQETKLSSEAEFLKAVREHFPLLEEFAKKALTNWTSTEDSDN